MCSYASADKLIFSAMSVVSDTMESFTKLASTSLERHSQQLGKELIVELGDGEEENSRGERRIEQIGIVGVGTRAQFGKIDAYTSHQIGVHVGVVLLDVSVAEFVHANAEQEFVDVSQRTIRRNVAQPGAIQLVKRPNLQNSVDHLGARFLEVRGKEVRVLIVAHEIVVDQLHAGVERFLVEGGEQAVLENF
jgi:hypothetical protein